MFILYHEMYIPVSILYVTDVFPTGLLCSCSGLSKCLPTGACTVSSHVHYCSYQVSPSARYEQELTLQESNRAGHTTDM